MKLEFLVLVATVVSYPGLLQADPLPQFPSNHVIDDGVQARRACQETFAGNCPEGYVVEKTTSVRCDSTYVWGAVAFDAADPTLKRMCACVYQKPDPGVPGGKGTFRCEELINRPLGCIVEEDPKHRVQRNIREKWCSSGVIPQGLCTWSFEIPPSVLFGNFITGNTAHFTQFVNEIAVGEYFDKIMSTWLNAGKPEGFFNVRCNYLVGYDEELALPLRTKKCQEAMIKGEPKGAFQIGQCMERGTIVSNVPCCVEEKKGMKGEEEGGLRPSNTEN